MGVRRLYLLRHAKSSWKDPGLTDHDRPLAARGRRTAKLLAGHLRRERSAPALVLCSAASRTSETLEGISSALGDETQARIEPELYGASDDALLERLRAIPDTVQSVMLIGHNPAIQALALTLAGRGDQLARVERKYPTGAIATLTFACTWRELEPGVAELVEFVRPKDLA